MADTGIFATTAEIVRKAGAGASSTATAEAYTNDFIAQAESYINAITRYNWSDVYSTLNADVKSILKLAGSNMAAMFVINYDMGGYTSRFEATTMLDILYDGFNKAIQELKEIKVRDFVNDA